MPICKITVTKKIKDKETLVESTIKELSKLLGKPEGAVMLFIDDNITGAKGNFYKDNCLYAEIASINWDYSTRNNFSINFCKFLSEELSIEPELIYLNLQDAPSRNIGIYSGIIVK